VKASIADRATAFDLLRNHSNFECDIQIHRKQGFLTQLHPGVVGVKSEAHYEQNRPDAVFSM
jgi:hypothetical protein